MTNQDFTRLNNYRAYMEANEKRIAYFTQVLACCEHGTYGEQSALEHLDRASQALAHWSEKYRALYNA